MVYPGCSYNYHYRYNNKKFSDGEIHIASLKIVLFIFFFTSFFLFQLFPENIFIIVRSIHIDHWSLFLFPAAGKGGNYKNSRNDYNDKFIHLKLRS